MKSKSAFPGTITPRVDQFRDRLLGDYGQARNADRPQNERAQLSPRIGRERKFNRQIKRLG